MRNYWINRIEEKERIAKVEKQLELKKKKDFVPPIYKKIGDPTHPRYGNNKVYVIFYDETGIHGNIGQAQKELYSCRYKATIDECNNLSLEINNYVTVNSNSISVLHLNVSEIIDHKNWENEILSAFCNFESVEEAIACVDDMLI